VTNLAFTRRCELCEHVLDETWQGGTEVNALLRARGTDVWATRAYFDSSTRRPLRVCWACDVELLETILRSIKGRQLEGAIARGRTS